MKIEELPSGSYRVRKQINKKNVSAIFDHYPNETEILLAFCEKGADNSYLKDKMTFYVAATQYINSKRNVLSPKTIREYIGQNDRLSEEFTSININDIDQFSIQKEINRLSEKLSPKTVKNYYAFITAVMGVFRPELIIRATLPQLIQKEPHIPSDDDVRVFLEYIKTERPKYYVLMVLAAYGLRRSEILAITDADLSGQTLHINKAKVIDENNEWVIKTDRKSTRLNSSH